MVFTTLKVKKTSRIEQDRLFKNIPNGRALSSGFES